MKRLISVGIILTSGVQAADTLDVIEVKNTLERPHWQELDKTKILTGKKNRTSEVNYLPPVQTDNNRQHFSQHASIYAPEQTTEPWTAMSWRGIGDPHEAQNILILQDGLPVAVDMYGQPGNYYSPPAPLMQELQVIAGGGALMYGPQPGGAINYISPKLTKGMETSGKVNLAGGSYNLASTVNSILGSRGKTSYYAGYYRKQGDGYQRSNADFHADYLQLKTHTFLEGNDVFKFSFQGYDSDYGMPGGMALTDGANANTWGGDNRKATRKYDRLRIARAQVMLGYEKKITSDTYLDTQLWANAYKRYNKTQATSGNQFGTFATGNSNTINDVRAYGFNGEVRVNHSYRLWDNRHSVSVGLLSFNTNSPTHAMTGSGPASNSGVTTSRSQRETRVSAVFLENKFNFGKWSLVPGVRYENIHLSNFNRTTELHRADTYNVLLGGLGASYILNDDMQAFANISQGFKPISYGDVLSQANPTQVIDGDIRPSYNYFYEAGLRGETKKIAWDSSFYLIQRQNVVATSGNVLSNGTSVHYRGVESSMTLKDIFNSNSAHEFDFYSNINFLNARFNKGNFKGKTPAYVPSALIKYGLIYRQQDRIHASLLATYVNEHFADDIHTDNRKIPSYSLFDFIAEFQINKSWSFNGAVNNLLDRKYYARVMATGILPTMGRNMYMGVNYKF